MLWHEHGFCMYKAVKIVIAICAGILITACSSTRSSAVTPPTTVTRLAATSASQATSTIKAAPTTPSGLQLTPTSSIVTSSPIPSAWNDFPIMPQSTEDQEGATSYTYTIKASPQEVQDYYKREMPKFGWKLLTVGAAQNNNAIMLFQKNATPGNIIIKARSDGTTYVVLSKQ